MRILIDATFLVPGRVGGAEQMVKTLVAGMDQAADEQMRLIVLTDYPWEASARVRFVSAPPGHNRFFRASRAVRHAESVDAVLSTNYFTPIGVRRTTPTVTVIHDLQYRHHPEFFSLRKRAWLRFAHRNTMRRARTVVAISDFVRRDLLHAYGERWGRKITTVWNPVSWARFDEASASPSQSGEYILAVAAQYPHKNLTTLVAAFARLVARGFYPDARLVLVGQLGSVLHGVSRVPDLEAQIDSARLRDRVVVTGFVGNAELGALYRGARVFAFPSLFEGFALPPVEALGVGLPVVTTNRGSIPEVTLGLARYLSDPLDVEAMASALAETWEEPDRFRPSAEGVELVRRTFDPSTIASRYLDLLVP